MSIFEVGQKWYTRGGKLVTIVYINEIALVLEDENKGVHVVGANGRMYVGSNTNHADDLFEQNIPPRYRPFANRYDFAPYRDKWVKNKHDGTLTCRIGGYDDSFVFFPPIQDAMTYEKCFETLVFEDETPFGVKIA